jgi:hypothetical protein
MRSTGVALAVLATFIVGCSSSYIPATGPRLSVVMEGGTPTYVRDGKKFEGGFLGGDIEEAVHGSPKVYDAVNAYNDDLPASGATAPAGR